MKIRVRLYHCHDIDLVSLYREGRISIPRTVKYTLNAFAQKRYVLLETNDKIIERPAKKVYMFNVVLDEEKDKNAIELLSRIEKGYHNNFIKQLLRTYLCFTFPDCYTSAENISYFTEREKCIFGERETIPAPAGRNIRKKPDTIPESVLPETGEIISQEIPLDEMKPNIVSYNKKTILSTENSERKEAIADETSEDETELVDFFKNLMI